MTCPLRFRRRNDVEKQVRVAVDQARQQRRAAEIDRFDVAGRVRLHLQRRTNFLDLAVFNQHGCGRKHIPSARIEQAASFYSGFRRRRLGGQLCSSKYSDCERKDSAYVHVFVSDEMHQNHFCSRARKNLRNLPARYVANLCSLAGTNTLLEDSHLGITARCPPIWSLKIL